MRASFSIEGALDVALTMRSQAMWGGTSWMAVDESGGWVAERNAGGDATVRMARVGDAVEAEAWGPGGEVLLARVPELLGLRDDPSVCRPAHPVVADLCRRLAGLRIGRTGQVFPRLVSAALAQKVTGQEARSALHAIANAWGAPAPGPRTDLRLLPEPERLARVPVAAFHPLGVEARRATLVRRIADRARALEKAAGMPFADAHRHLQALPGIGPWTSGVVVGLALGDPDAVPFGDYNLPNLVAWNLAGEARADDARMAELLAPYAGQRGRVVRLLKAGGAKAPRFGPRMPVRDIRGI